MTLVIMMCDPEGLPRAFGVAPREQEARAEAERQLELYRAKQRELGDPLADAAFTPKVVPALTEAHAQLMTAAPDLLKAGKELLWVLSGRGPHRASSIRAATKDLRDAMSQEEGDMAAATLTVTVRDIVAREVELPATCPKCGADLADPTLSALRVHQLETSSQRGWMDVTGIMYDDTSADDGRQTLARGYQCAQCDHFLAMGEES